MTATAAPLTINLFVPAIAGQVNVPPPNTPVDVAVGIVVVSGAPHIFLDV